VLSQGRDEHAWLVTKRLHASKNDSQDTYAHAEYRQMKKQIEFEKSRNIRGPLGQAKLAFSQKSYQKRLALGFLVQFGNQCTGALVIGNYFTQLFIGLGIKAPMSLLLLGKQIGHLQNE
jgi:Sugar (and other) transporter